MPSTRSDSSSAPDPQLPDALAAALAALVPGARATAADRVAGGSICAAYRVDLAGGERVFVKILPDAPPGLFACEAEALDWLRVEGGPPVPAVLGVNEGALALEWVEPGRPTPEGERELGVALAALHASGPPSFGWTRTGYLGDVPQDNAACGDWAEFLARRRILPMARRALDAGGLTADAARDAEALCRRLPDLVGPPQAPSRLHGDLWAGNVHWSARGEAWLVDPAPYGGHREMDLAMLSLFGAPGARVMAAYQDAARLDPGWQERVALCQVYPLLMHAARFGGAYGGWAHRAIRTALGSGARGA